MAKSQHYNNNNDRLVDVLPVHEDTQPEINAACRAWNYHRTITFLASIDLVFLLLYGGFVNPIIALFALFPIFGIFGAKTFRKSCIVIYLLYVTFQLAFYMWLGIAIPAFFVFYLISFFVHLWIAKIVCTFYLDLNRLSPETISNLRNGTLIPQVVNIVLW
jgi:hypothetical protein